MKKMMKNMEVVMNQTMITMETHIRRRNYQRNPLRKTQLVRREAVNQKAKLKKMLNTQKNKHLQQQLLEHLKLNRTMPLKSRKDHLLILYNQKVKESLELVPEDYHLIWKYISQLSRNTNPLRKKVKPIINLAKILPQKSNKPQKQMEKLKPIMKMEMR